MADRVTSRASLRLPAIQHPSAKLGDPETLSLLGRSTYSPAGRESFHPGLGGASSRSFRRSPPDGGSCAQVVSAPDPSTTTLPVFGQKKTPKSRAGSSIVASSSCYGAQLRIKVEQLEHELRKKTQSAGSLALMGIFKNNNPEGKAVVSRDVLLVVLTKFLGRQITMKQFRHLLLRLHLSEKPAIGFEELCGALREPVLASPRAMRASHVLSLLRGPTTSRFLELTECVASNESNRPGWIVAPKLRNILEQLDIYMDDREFHKLWERFDSGGTGAVQLSVLLNKLGRTDRNCVEDEHENVAQQTAANAEHSERKTISVEPRVLSNAEEERRTSIAVETWLKDRLREGVQKMRMEFEKLDATCSGKVTPHEFLQILNSFDLHLKPMQLSLFLARCGLELRKSGVDYPEFLRRFQDRSEDGVLHRILSDPKHRFHKEENISHTSSITAVETRLAKLFQSEYLSLLQAFKGIDKFNKKTVSREEFRAVVESRFGLEISEPEFEQLLDRLPLDPHGNVQYPIFMAAFDTRRGVSSLFHSRTPISCGNRDNSDDDGIQNLEESTGKARECRTVRQLFCIIKGLVRSHYQAVEKVFEELDEQNTRRLTQEMMYQLLKRFDIRPEVSRGQIRQLWSTLMTQHDGTVDFLQFVRHFGPSLKSSRFPNAKVCPPKQGDDNLRRRSNKLNCVFDILANTVRAKVELALDELRGRFMHLDPYYTGFVSQEEFNEVLRALCPHLSEYECDVLAKKFDVNGDNRVSYSEFLRPFGTQKQAWRNGANMAAVLQSHREPEEPISQEHKHDLASLNVKLKKLQKKQRALRRAFRRLDNLCSGHLPVAELRTVLQLCGVSLDQEELYHLLSKLDQDLKGHVDYRALLHNAESLQESLRE